MTDGVTVHVMQTTSTLPLTRCHSSGAEGIYQSIHPFIQLSIITYVSMYLSIYLSSILKKRSLDSGRQFLQPHLPLKVCQGKYQVPAQNTVSQAEGTS